MSLWGFVNTYNIQGISFTRYFKLIRLLKSVVPKVGDPDQDFLGMPRLSVLHKSAAQVTTFCSCCRTLA